MSGPPLIIAHRGASAHAPENTFAAFQEAIDVGADGIEFDVRLSRDGVPVVFHDEDLKRIAGRAEKISDLTAAELAEIDIGSWFNRAFPHRSRSEFSNERIKTLAETLGFLSGFTGRIFAELKCTLADAEELSKSVCTLICGSPLLPRIIVKSFTLTAIPYVRRFCPDARTAALFEPTVRSVLRKQKNIIGLAEQVGADGLSMHYTLATARLCRLARANGLPITIWTVDDTKWRERAVTRGIGAIITNDPRLWK
ncbi:MAG: glycerophosphodiester phosphodiesterase family protein [Acidobacteriota bacterium]